MKKLIAFFSMIALAASILVMPVMADGTRVVTIGQDLTDEQEAFIINYFGADLSTAQVIYVNNQQEREYVGSWIPLEQIGNITISSAYVQPTSSGGIQVKTANLTYVTGNMIASVLSTAGVKNCNIVAAAPFPVSGTGALTGVMIAYQTATGQALDQSKRDLAVQEFTVTQQASESIGENEALQLVNAVKMEVIQSEVAPENTEEIQEIVDQVINNYIQQNQVSDQSVNNIDNSVTNIDNSSTVINNGLSDEDRQLIIDLAAEIARQDYQYDDMKETLERVEENLSNQTNINIAIENNNENTSENNITNTNDTEVINEIIPEDTPEEDSILSSTNDDLIDVSLQSSTREEDIAVIEEALAEEQAAQEEQNAEDPFAGYDMQEEVIVIDTNEPEEYDTSAYFGEPDFNEEPAPAPEAWDTPEPEFPEEPVYDQAPEFTEEPVYGPETGSPEDTWIEYTESYDEAESEPDVWTETGDVFTETEDTFTEPEAESEEYPEPVFEGPVLGGWQVYADAAETVLPENVQAAFENGMQGLLGEDYTPVAFLGTQIVAGTNYRILCVGTPVVPDPVPELKAVTIYEDLDGNASVTEIADVDLAKIEETAPEDAQVPEGMLMGGWFVPETAEAAELPEDAQAAFDAAMEGLLGVDYTPAALLGTKVIAGTEYAVLCHAVPVTAEPVSYYAVAFIAANADGTCSLMNIVPLNVAELSETAE